MSFLKVNPKLNGTCRLCLEDMGQYLIEPDVQEQIKYCFDINVEPLDGLPQFLCNKCEGILKDFYETKKNIVDKQNDFINKIHIEKAQKQHSEKIYISKQNDSQSELPKSSVAKRKQIVLSFSCSRPDQASQSTATKNKKDTKKSLSWPTDYNKQYSCRLCNYRGRKKQNIVRHTSSSHKNLKLKHQSILNNNCIIKLEKLDKLPNITGFDDTVVISRDTIVQDIDKNYCLIYTSKTSDGLLAKTDKSDNSDDEHTVRKKQKISDETLKLKKDIEESLINTNDETKEMGNGDCIRIDDSSDSASEKDCHSIQDQANSNNAVSLKKVLPTVTTHDYCTKIQNIISICHNKYKKNIDLHKLDRKQPNDPALSKSQLKHKVLSIGRKIINKQGFNCTGLLRYMEHRNLEIVWTPNKSNYNSDTNYVRIMTKLSANVVNEDEIGWKSCKSKNKGNHTTHTISGDLMPKISQVFYSDINMHWKVDNKTKLLNKNPVANPKQMPIKKVVIEKHKDAVPDTLTQTCPNNMQQDVSKQKQLSDNAGSMPDLSPMTSDALHQNGIYEQNINIEHKENDTSTLQKNVNNDTEISGGRIKVKPLAELLSKESFMNTFVLGNSPGSKPLSQEKQSPMFTCMVKANDFIQSSHITQPGYVSLASQVGSTSPIVKPNQSLNTNDTSQTNYTFATIHAVQPTLIVHTKEINLTVPSNQRIQLMQTAQQDQIQINQQLLVAQSQSSSAPSSQTEFVIMDTVELPSTKTHSPIQYLENLLLTHDIQLLDQTKQELSKEFVCLIKFKVMYKQETMEEPILLSLSLFCHKNKFCMKVKNVNQQNINISKLSANWQWEIIKVFKGDVTNKLLQNAQKVNQETYEYAKTFLCLLKSINYTKV